MQVSHIRRRTHKEIKVMYLIQLSFMQARTLKVFILFTPDYPPKPSLKYARAQKLACAQHRIALIPRYFLDPFEASFHLITVAQVRIMDHEHLAPISY
ncbi:hypothetical protein CCYS_08755 [Corynebacterium cystitidis DSM 20524]|uniref:Uncharacterized protein n=1 Tax=Corynebacterium cystitidis DSM 20524 TaxID=1121357 RepID=A0A1H9NZY9_9CORY|nr:hypothetical protein CCYS_08755 [Corynebacterium cystitidis DSM 20524]SER41500.1 hypothetical protein SAMN05661109_00166 [Corynebacterium cystitidis DSM 20524]SNV72089.1 Uncharacterised protein [Corynebacterium cystitidis]